MISIIDVVNSPDDPWAWVGLVGDTLDLIPFITGLGETAKAAKVTSRVVDGLDDVVDASKVAKRVDDTGDSLKSIKKIHGNSLSSTRKTYGYVLVDNETGAVMKYGESIYGKSRYSNKFYLENGVSMNILTDGSKYDMHFWQNKMIHDYYNAYGKLPPMNKSFW